MTRRPKHNEREVARLALQGRVRATMRVTAWLANHDYGVAETLTAILTSVPAKRLMDRFD